MTRRLLHRDYDQVPAESRLRLATTTSSALLGADNWGGTAQEEVAAALTSPAKESLLRLWTEAGGVPQRIALCVLAAQWLSENADTLAASTGGDLRPSEVHAAAQSLWKLVLDADMVAAARDAREVFLYAEACELRSLVPGTAIVEAERALLRDSAAVLEGPPTGQQALFDVRPAPPLPPPRRRNRVSQALVDGAVQVDLFAEVGSGS